VSGDRIVSCEGIVRTVNKGFAFIDIIPSSDELYRVESMNNGLGSLFTLKDFLKKFGLLDRYRVIILDTPPNLGVLTNIALVCADYFLVPVSPGKYALKGLDRMFEIAQIIKKTVNPDLGFLGIVINNFRKHEQPSRALEKSVRDLYKDSYIVPPVRRTVDLQKSEIMSEPIQLAFPNSDVVNDIKRLSMEVLKRGESKKQEA
jgi:chromosome partitioning protein